MVLLTVTQTEHSDVKWVFEDFAKRRRGKFFGAYFVGSVTRPRKRILPHRVSRIRNRKGWSAVAGRTTNKPRLKPTGVSSRIAFQRESQPR